MTDIFLTCAIAIFIYMNIFYVIAQVIKDNSIVDIGWGLGFIVVAATALWKSQNFEAEATLMAIIIAIWGLRLAIYIFQRNKGKGEDFRYKKWREEWGRNQFWRAYLQVFMLQGSIMWVVALPVMMTIAQTGDKIGFLDIAGAAIWLFGFFFEAVADYQMSAFKKNPENKGEIMQEGLWKYSRHPNYFGESVMWWGIFFIALGNGNPLLALVSPALMTYLLLRVSGVTMLEKKYEGNPKYRDYIRRTSAFVPGNPKK